MSTIPPVALRRTLCQWGPLYQAACSRYQPQGSFFALVTDCYPQVFDLLMAVLQRQLFTLNPLLDVEGNPSISPSSPVSSEQAVAINSDTPVMGFIPPSFSNYQPSGFQLLLFVAHAACIGVKALQLACRPCHLPRGTPFFFL